MFGAFSPVARRAGPSALAASGRSLQMPASFARPSSGERRGALRHRDRFQADDAGFIEDIVTETEA
jgi:hypothetical protein